MSFHVSLVFCISGLLFYVSLVYMLCLVFPDYHFMFRRFTCFALSFRIIILYFSGVLLVRVIISYFADLHVLPCLSEFQLKFTVSPEFVISCIICVLLYTMIVNNCTIVSFNLHFPFALVVYCRSLFVLLSFFFWPLCYLFFFELRILITRGIFKLFLLYTVTLLLCVNER